MSDRRKVYFALVVCFFILAGFVVACVTRAAETYEVGPTGSMTPFLNAGDRLVVDKVKVADVKVGDVVVFWPMIPRGSLIVHRVTKVEGQRLFTKGDANPFADAFWVDQKRLIGRVVFVLPPAHEQSRRHP